MTMKTKGILQILALFPDDPNQRFINSFNNREGLMGILIHKETDAEIIKIFAPLMNDPNKPEDEENGVTAIFFGTMIGNFEVVKCLASLTDNPNLPVPNTAMCFPGYSPLHVAALNGFTEIVRFLAPLADNPNARNGEGKSPLDFAKRLRHGQEVVKILAPFADNH